MQWKNVHVFISSTFNDMHAERDYLVKSVFPALSEWCEARKLRLIDIDLRWGVSEADATQNKRVVQVCLDRIDECRPFFLCFIGQRRGWVPTDTDVSPETIERFPGLGNRLGSNSVTEMEILHALIDPLHNGSFFDKEGAQQDGAAVEHAFFYLRDPAYLKAISGDLSGIYTNKAESNPEAADQALNHWRDVEIPQTNRPVRHYSASWNEDENTPEIALPLVVPTTAPQDSESWKIAFNAWQKRWEAVGITVNANGEIAGAELDKAKAYNNSLTAGRLGNFHCGDAPLLDVIVEELKNAIEKRYPDNMTIEEETPLQKELDQQAQFLRTAVEGFIERTGDFDALNEYVGGGENRPFAITAYAGMGKSSLLAHWIDKCPPQTGESLHYRFIGASDDSVSAERLIRSILNELKEAGKINHEIPASPIDMIKKLPDLLTEAGKSGKIVLVIDALNQLESGMNGLFWIPSTLPENVKLIVSFKRGEESAEEYYRQQEEAGSMILHAVKPFDGLADRKALVSVYLNQYFKELDEPRIQTLIRADGAENPLFLKTMLSELRVFGVHNDLSEVIRSRFGNNPVTAFQAVLTRIENDPAYSKLPLAVVLPRVFGWIAHSKYGMSVDELAQMLMREKLAESKTDALDAIFLVLRQLRAFLAKRDGRIDFFYESFKVAAIERYTGEHPYARKSGDWHRSLAEYFGALPIGNQHKLMEQAWQYAQADMRDDLMLLLYHYPYIETRLEQFSVGELLDDYALSDDPDIKLMRGCLQLSVSALYAGKDLLAGQIWGRLADSKNDRVIDLLNQIVSLKAARNETWLRPIRNCLEPPGVGVTMIYKQDHNAHGAAFVNDKGLLYLPNADNGNLEIITIPEGRVLQSYTNINSKLFRNHESKLLVSTDGNTLVYPERAVHQGALGMKVVLLHLPSQSAREIIIDGNPGHVEEFMLAGDYILCLDANMRVTVIHIPSGEITMSFVSKVENPNNRLTGIDTTKVCIGSDGAVVFVQNSLSSVEAYYTASGNKTAAFTDEKIERITGMLLSPDSATLYLLCGRGVFAFLARTGEKLWAIESNFIVPRAALSENGRYLGIIETIRMKVFDLETRLMIAGISSDSGTIGQVAFNKTCDAVAAMNSNCGITVYSTSSGQVMRTFKGHTVGKGSKGELFFTQSGEYLISSGWDDTVRLWDMNAVEATEEADDIFTSINIVGVAPDGRLMATVQNCIYYLDARTGVVTGKVPLDTNVKDSSCNVFRYAKVGTLAFRLASIGSIVYGTSNHIGEVFDAVTGKRISIIEMEQLPNSSVYYINDAHFTPDGRAIWYLDEKANKLVLKDVDNTFVEAVDTGHTSVHREMYAFDDGKGFMTLESAAAQNGVAFRTWDAQNGKNVHMFGLPSMHGSSTATTVQVLDNDKFLIFCGNSYSHNKEIFIADAKKGMCLGSVNVDPVACLLTRTTALRMPSPNHRYLPISDGAEVNILDLAGKSVLDRFVFESDVINLFHFEGATIFAISTRFGTARYRLALLKLENPPLEYGGRKLSVDELLDVKYTSFDEKGVNDICADAEVHAQQKPASEKGPDEKQKGFISRLFKK